LGGYTGDDGRATAAAEIYDPATGQFSETGSMKIGRFDFTATVLRDGRVLVAGGDNNGDEYTTYASAEIYDPISGRFSPTGSMKVARNGATATLLDDGTVLIAGGNDGDVATAELFDPATGKFSDVGSTGCACYQAFSSLLPGGRVVLVGSNDTTSSTEIYDPVTRKFSGSSPFIGDGGMTIDAASATGQGPVLVLGHTGVMSATSTSIELYWP
jgi:hypothetical protein